MSDAVSNPPPSALPAPPESSDALDAPEAPTAADAPTRAASPPCAPLRTEEAADLAAARNGDHAAFARLYDRHAAVVLSLCRRFAGTLTEADDALQETFIRAYGRLERVDGPARLRPWLYAIARRVCAERRRSSRRRLVHEDRATMLNTQAIQSGATADGLVVERASKREQLASLDAAMARLDDRQRLALHLYYLDADPIAAAASSLRLSRSGYYKLLHQARERLASLMREVHNND